VSFDFVATVAAKGFTL